MKKNTILVFRIGMIALSLLALGFTYLYLPRFIESTVLTTNISFIKYLYVIIASITNIPIFISFIQANMLLNGFQSEEIFTDSIIKSFKVVMLSGLSIVAIHLIPIIVMVISGNVSIIFILLSSMVIFVAIIITSLIYLLQKVFINAFVIKQENDLTV